MTEFTTWRSLVDGEVIEPIPDPENLQANWDLQQQTESDTETINQLTDSENDYHMEAVGSPTMDTTGYNDNPAAIVDQEGFRIAPEDWDTITQPFTFYAVFELDRDESGNPALMRPDDDAFFAIYNVGNGWQIRNGSELVGSEDETINFLTGLANGSESVIEEDGEQTASGDAGTGDLTNVTFGHRSDFRDQDDDWEGKLMQLLIYDDGHDSETRSDVYDFLIARWR